MIAIGSGSFYACPSAPAQARLGDHPELRSCIANMTATASAPGTIRRPMRLAE